MGVVPVCLSQICSLKFAVLSASHWFAVQLLFNILWHLYFEDLVLDFICSCSQILSFLNKTLIFVFVILLNCVLLWAFQKHLCMFQLLLYYDTEHCILMTSPWDWQGFYQLWIWLFILLFISAFFSVFKKSRIVSLLSKFATETFNNCLIVSLESNFTGTDTCSFSDYEWSLNWSKCFWESCFIESYLKNLYLYQNEVS